MDRYDLQDKIDDIIRNYRPGKDRRRLRLFEYAYELLKSEHLKNGGTIRIRTEKPDQPEITFITRI
jgi:hypothetical protein